MRALDTAAGKLLARDAELLARRAAPLRPYILSAANTRAAAALAS